MQCINVAIIGSLQNIESENEETLTHIMAIAHNKACLHIQAERGANIRDHRVEMGITYMLKS